jgi:mRNA-degrading endonuclease YafQ of YafQ-DinJ toxin-antitoxin module
MRVALTDRFQDDVRRLDERRRIAVLDVLPALPRALGAPHPHGGVGLRKIHASGIWEARLGLDVRLVFTVGADTITLVRAGTHDEIRRYLRSL